MKVSSYNSSEQLACNCLLKAVPEAQLDSLYQAHLQLLIGLR